MKKMILMAVILVLFSATVQASSLFNGRLTGQLTAPATASASAVAGPALFYGFTVVTDGTNACTINVYDSLTAAGTKLVPTDFYITGASRTFSYSLDPGVKVSTGIYFSISVAGGGSASYQVEYDQ